MKLLLGVSLLCCVAAAWWPLHVLDGSSKHGPDGIKMLRNGSRLYAVSPFEDGHIGATRFFDVIHNRSIEVAAFGREDAVPVDIDGDGDIDVIACDWQQCYWVEALGSRYFHRSNWRTHPLSQTKLPLSSTWMQVTPAVLNGSLSLVLGGSGRFFTGRVAVLLGSRGSNVTEWEYHNITLVQRVMALETFDVNGDGHTDILVSNRDGNYHTCGVIWYENPSWTAHCVWHHPTQTAAFLSVADVDDDGCFDIVLLASEPSHVYAFQGFCNGTFELMNNVSISGFRTGKGITVADFFCTGEPVIAYVLDSEDKKPVTLMRHLDWRVAGWPWPDTNEWNHTEITNVTGKMDQLVLEDADNDGDLDIFTTQERPDDRVFWLENPSHCTMSPSSSPATQLQPLTPLALVLITYVSQIFQ